MKIEYLEIYTSAIKEQLNFYRDVLGFSITKNSENNFRFSAGFTEICFQFKKDAKPYHIAFHLPAHQEDLALNWLKERVVIEKNDTEEIIDFKNWKAKSVYFKDPDDNILELISRRDLYPSQKKYFNVNSILGVSEIGLAVEIIEPYYTYLHRQFGLGIYDGNLDRFCAIGDDEGLIIAVNRHNRDWFPTNQTAFAADFKINFTHQGSEFSFTSKDV
ncbi:VOC family protein [Zunongwangia profunda]|uniref:Glyoxalase n=1 Tax=Zunongwangia profunda TaxID=398743 RepID=A0A3D5IUL3_9FLAO|nr:VOC family protein [Zunongwangia profunda]HCV79579.1 glyoxalase [Zunongwangia profunda]|tara:strand:+ start:4654 stop:5304 length:651 start_codon:yes stop_codon:yes gene_type:complete